LKAPETKKLAKIPASERILLLPHCLRQAETCKAKYNKDGLECTACNPLCAINRLSEIALRLGYQGVCVAPGGRLAVNYVNEKRPRAIVAIACQKELEEGIGNVNELADQYTPIVLIIPLTKDGCINTEVDVDGAIKTIAVGCPVAI
jgi:hypothetical protein